jgi:uncharacterized coiled-coil protein SlyX
MRASNPYNTTKEEVKRATKQRDNKLIMELSEQVTKLEEQVKSQGTAIDNLASRVFKQDDIITQLLAINEKIAQKLNAIGDP